MTTGQEITALIGHAGSVRAVTFSPDGRLLASGGQDGTVRLALADLAGRNHPSHPEKCGLPDRFIRGTIGALTMATLHIQLLGDFCLACGGEAVATLDTPRQQSLLAYLLLNRQAPQPRHHVAFVFWPEATEPQARANLRKHLYDLRRDLPDADRFLCVTGNTVQWQPEAPFTLDVAEFESEITAARQAEQAGDHIAPRQALQQAQDGAQDTAMQAALERAVELYQGDLLPSCYDDWVLPERERLSQMHIRALDRLIQRLAGQGEYAAAIRYAQRLLRHDPLHETAYRRLMRLHAVSGDRASALRVYQTCVNVLEQELGVEPSPATREVHERLVNRTPAARRPTLPAQATPFIGRETELVRIKQLLGDPACRLLTLIGPGGIGKTRLALEAGAQQSETFQHGVYFIPCAAVDAKQFLVPAIADALKLDFRGSEDPQAQLLDYLREKQMLLLMDSFEHLLEAACLCVGRQAGLLGDILAAAPQVKILVTSRERLNLQWEWLLDVAGLDFPEEETASRSEDYSAVQLFLQGAHRVRPGWSPSEAELQSVVRICQLVQGMPLGIELAAAGVRKLACRTIAEEIETNYAFLAASLRDIPERHQSLRVAFAHSWNLLSAEGRRVFRRLSVFRGGFGADAAEHVAGASVARLTDLVDKSLLHGQPSERYEMHELLRQYAAEKLQEVPPETEEVRDRHCEYYLAFLHQREKRLEGASPEEALAEISQEIQNVRAAWRRAVAQGRVEEIGKALESLYRFYEMRSWFEEGEDAFRRAVQRISDDEKSETCAELCRSIRNAALSLSKGPKSEIILGKVLSRQAAFRLRLSRYDQTKGLLQSSLRIARQLDAPEDIAFALTHLADRARLLGEHLEAKRLHQESLAVYRQIGDRPGIASSLNYLGNLAYTLGRHAEAEQRYRESLPIRREIGHPLGIAQALSNLGMMACQHGHYHEAERLYQESLTLFEESDSRAGIATCLLNLGGLAYLQGDYAQAKLLYQQNLAIRREIGHRWGIAYALIGLGNIAEAEAEYAEAQQLYEEAHAICREIGHPWGTAYTLINLGSAAGALGAFQESRQYFHQALRRAQQMRAVPLVLGVLVGMAAPLAHEGRMERSVELLALALHHPATDHETRVKAERLLTELEPRVPPRALETALARGKTMKLEEVVDEMLAAAP